LEAAPDAVLALDDDGRVRRANRAAERLFGRTRDELIAQPADALLVASAASGAGAAPAGLLDTPLDEPIEMLAVRNGGDRVRVHVIPTRSGERAPLTAFVRELQTTADPQLGRLLAAAEDIAHIGSWELELSSPVGLWTDEMYRIHGLEPGAVEPGPELLLELMHPDDRDRIADLLRTVVERPDEVPAAGVTGEYRALRPDGTVVWVWFHGRVERDVSGRPARWVGTAQDLSDHRLTERELHAHFAVGQALRDWESFDEGVVVLLRRLGTALDLPMGSLWTRRTDTSPLHCRAFWRAPTVDPGEFEPLTRATTFMPGQGLPGRVWETGGATICPDISEYLDYRRRAAAQAIGVRSSIVFAAEGDEGVVAALSFYSFDRRSESPRLERTLTGIGRELGRFLAARRAELEPGPLSARELQVLRLAAEGNSGPAIASELTLSPGTVKTHFENIYEKLGVSDRAAAVAQALRIGMFR
jgi:PAS domain S-box-containing protein